MRLSAQHFAQGTVFCYSSYNVVFIFIFSYEVVICAFVQRQGLPPRHFYGQFRQTDHRRKVRDFAHYIMLRRVYVYLSVTAIFIKF